MTTCTSRRVRADNDHYRFKLYKELDGKEIIGNYIWIEYRCPNAVAEGKDVCTNCAIKLPKYKYLATPKCDHGTVGGPYPSDSKLYGSPYYLNKIKEGWKIKEADELRAKEAQLIASSSMPKKPASSTEPTEAKVDVVTQVPKKPRKIRVSKNATDVVLAPVQAVESVKTLEPAKFVESISVPIKVSDVIVVKVKKIHINGKDYYVDRDSGKAYAVLTNGVGEYKGRYDSDSETLDTRFPDSDLE